MTQWIIEPVALFGDLSFPVLMRNYSQPPVTPAPEDPNPSSGLSKDYIYLQIGTHIHIYLEIINIKKLG